MTIYQSDEGYISGHPVNIDPVKIAPAQVNPAPIDALKTLKVDVEGWTLPLEEPAGEIEILVHFVPLTDTAVQHLLVNGEFYVTGIHGPSFSEQVAVVKLNHPGGNLPTLGFQATVGQTSVGCHEILRVRDGSPVSTPVTSPAAKVISNVQLSSPAGGQRIDVTVNFPVLSYGRGNDALPASSFDPATHWEWNTAVQGPVDPLRRAFDLTGLPDNVDVPVFFRPLDGSAIVRQTIHTLGSTPTNPTEIVLWNEPFDGVDGTLPAGVTAHFHGGAGTAVSIQANQLEIDVVGRSGQDDYGYIDVSAFSAVDGYHDFQWIVDTNSTHGATIFGREDHGLYPDHAGVAFGIETAGGATTGVLAELVLAYRDVPTGWHPQATKPFTPPAAGTLMYGRFQHIGDVMWGYLGLVPFGNQQWNAQNPNMISSAGANNVAAAGGASYWLGQHGYASTVHHKLNNAKFTRVIPTANKALSNPVMSADVSGQVITFDFNFQASSYGRGNPAAPDWEWSTTFNGPFDPTWRTRSLTVLPPDTNITVFVRPADGTAPVTAVYRTGGTPVVTPPPPPGGFQLGFFQYGYAPALDAIGNTLGAKVMHASSYCKPAEGTDAFQPVYNNPDYGPHGGFTEWLKADPRRTMTQGFNWDVKDAGAWLDTSVDDQICNIILTEIINRGIASQVMIMLFEEMDGIPWSAAYDSAAGHTRFKGMFERISARIKAQRPGTKIITCVASADVSNWTAGGDAGIPSFLANPNSWDGLAVDIYDWLNGAGGDPDTGPNGPRWLFMKAQLDQALAICTSLGKFLAINEFALVNPIAMQGGGDDPWLIRQLYDYALAHMIYLTYFDVGDGNVNGGLSDYPQGQQALKDWLAGHSLQNG